MKINKYFLLLAIIAVLVVCLFLILQQPRTSKNHHIKQKAAIAQQLYGDWWVRIEPGYYFTLLIADTSTALVKRISLAPRISWSDDSVFFSYSVRRRNKIDTFSIPFKFLKATDDKLYLGCDGKKLFDKSLSEICLQKLLPVPENKSRKLQKIIIERTGCYGTCPVFKFELNANGAFYFLGEEYVDSIGSFTGIATSDIINLLQNKISNIHFEKLRSFYSTGWTDAELIRLRIIMRDSRSKKTYKYDTKIYGCEEAPYEILNVVYYVTSIVNNCLPKVRTTDEHRFITKGHSIN